MPAISSGHQITDALKQATGQTTASGSRQRMRAALVVAQVTVSFMLLVGAGLMLRSIVNLQRVDPGFRVDHLLTLRISANFSKYTTNQDFEQLADNVLRKLNVIGGVESAAIVSNYPFSKQGIVSGPGNTGIQIEGRLPAPGETPPQIDLTLVSPDYFNAIRQPLLEGRFFTDHDDHKAANVGIVNETMRRHWWPTENPIGKRLSTDQGQSWITIAGVVGDAREYGLQHDVLDEIYLPVKQFGGANRLVVRTATDPLSMVPLVRAALHDVDPQLAIDQVDSMDRLEQDSMTSPRTTTMLLGIFAGLVLHESEIAPEFGDIRVEGDRFAIG